MAFRDHAPERGEKVIHFLRREHGRGLVEDDQARAAVQRLHDLHPLLLSRRRAARRRRGGPSPEPVFLRELADPGGNFLQVQERAAGRALAQGDILRHGHGRHEHEVLVDHPDACPDCIRRGTKDELPAVDEDLPFVRLVQAVELPHQGALSRAVLPEQGVHFPRLDVEADLGIGHHAGKALHDVAHLRVTHLIRFL